MWKKTCLILWLAVAGCSDGNDEAARLDDAAWPVEPTAQMEMPPEPAPPPMPPADPYDLSSPRTCLAMAMYHEARGEGERAMLAVGHVVLNRAEARRFPADICEVVRQGGERPPCQFSWWCDGRSDRPRETKQWAVALGLADRLLAGTTEDPTGGATYFYGGKPPYWADVFEETATIGGHVFMVE